MISGWSVGGQWVVSGWSVGGQWVVSGCSVGGQRNRFEFKKNVNFFKFN